MNARLAVAVSLALSASFACAEGDVFGRKSTVAYVDGKKHGEERIVDRNGKLRQILHWNHGVQDGKAQLFDFDGKKVAKEEQWHDGEKKLVTAFYASGKMKEHDIFETPTRMHHEEFWENGKKLRDEIMIACKQDVFGTHWCEDGVETTWYEEDGTKQGEFNFIAGKQNGTKQWWNNGKPELEETWADGHLSEEKRWDQTGKLISDEEFEADGSPKIRR